MSIRRKLIREKATQLLDKAGVRGPQVDIERIARDQGTQIQKRPVEDDVSGFLFRDNNLGSAVIGVNSRQHKNRQRFTVAHELGHLLLHSQSGVHVDHHFQVKNRDGRSSQGTDIEEVEANLFAAEILMPEQFLRADIQNLCFDFENEQDIAELAARYGVSKQAMSYRLSSLSLVGLY